MTKWEYTFVLFGVGDRNAWRPAEVNDQTLPNWKRGPTGSEFANQLGEQGWELVATFSTGITPTLIFKRPKT